MPANITYLRYRKTCIQVKKDFGVELASEDQRPGIHSLDIFHFGTLDLILGVPVAASQSP